MPADPTLAESARRFAKLLVDQANRFDREQPGLREEWREHRRELINLVAWLDRLAEEAARG